MLRRQTGHGGRNWANVHSENRHRLIPDTPGAVWYVLTLALFLGLQTIICPIKLQGTIFRIPTQTHEKYVRSTEKDAGPCY